MISINISLPQAILEDGYKGDVVQIKTESCKFSCSKRKPMARKGIQRKEMLVISICHTPEWIITALTNKNL